MSKEISIEVKQHIGVISERENGWKKELNIISWNGGKPKYDIREWSQDHERLSKGITLTNEEAKAVCELLKGVFC